MVPQRRCVCMTTAATRASTFLTRWSSSVISRSWRFSACLRRVISRVRPLRRTKRPAESNSALDVSSSHTSRPPEEVNWYLRELVGCSHSKDGGRNYAFLGADPSKRRIYIPLAPAAPAPVVERWYEELKKLKYEVEHSNDRLKTRFLCMLDAMENRRG